MAWLKHNVEAKRPVMARLASTIKKQTAIRLSETGVSGAASATIGGDDVGKYFDRL